jgi:hypothetical protein
MKPAKLIALALCLLLAVPGLSHPGRTDSSGGHTDSRTGEYHYHGGGSSSRSTPSPAPAPTRPTYPAPTRPTYPTPPRPTTPRPAPRVTKPEPTFVRDIEAKPRTKIPVMGYPELIASLIEPEKLRTLGERGANSRLQKVVAFVEQASIQGFDPTNVVTKAVEIAGYTNTLLAAMTRDGVLHNHRLAREAGVLTEQGLGDMRRGLSPTIATGPHAGDELSVDHIVPRAKYPELDNVIANLELMPLKENMKKGDELGIRQREYLERFRAAQVVP